jgi:hypothetical protein
VPVVDVDELPVVAVAVVPEVPAVSVVVMVPVVPVAAVSVELAPVVLMAVSVAAVSVFTFSSFLQPRAKIETASRAMIVRARDFFIVYFSPRFVSGERADGCGLTGGI